MCIIRKVGEVYLELWKQDEGNTTALDLYLHLFVCFSSGSYGSSWFFCFYFPFFLRFLPFRLCLLLLPGILCFFHSLFCFSPLYPLLPYALPLSISLFVLFKRFPTLCFFLHMLHNSPSCLFYSPCSPPFSFFFFFLCFCLSFSSVVSSFSLMLGPSSGFYSQRMHALWKANGNDRRALWW